MAGGLSGLFGTIGGNASQPAAPAPYTPPPAASSNSSYQWQDPVYASLYNGAPAPASAQAFADDLNSGAYLARLQAAEAAGQPTSSVAVAGSPQAAPGYDWRAKFGGNNGWTNAYGLTLNAGDYATEDDFMKAYNAGILATNPAILGGVEQKADGSLFIGRDGGMKDDGNYYSGDLYDNGNTMGRYVLTPDTHVRLTGKDGEVLYEGVGTDAGPQLMDALSNGVNKGGKSTYNVQTMDGNGNWNTVVKGDPGPGLLGNFLTAMAITGGAVLAGSVLLPALGAGAGAGGAAGAAGAGAGAGTAAGGLGAGLGAGLGTGAGLGAGAGALAGDIVVTGALGGGLGAGALGALGAGALAGGAAALGGGASGASGAAGASGALPGDIVVTAPAAGSGVGSAVGGLAGLTGAGAAAGGAGAGSAPSQVDPASGDIVVNAPAQTGGLGGLTGTAGAVAGAGGAAASGGAGVVDPATGDITVTGSQGTPVGGLTAGGVAAGAGAAAAGGSSAATPKSTLDKIVDYLQLGALGTGLLGNLIGGSGSSGSGGTVPGGLNTGLNPVFTSQLPTASIPGGVGAASNLGPRTMPDQDWTKYAMHPEQSFFKYVPQQAYTPAPGAQ